MRTRLFPAAILVLSAGCVGPTIRPAIAPGPPRTDALLILPGFGYGRGDDAAFRLVASQARQGGVDLYVAPYLTRSGLESSRTKLERFVGENHLERYDRLHVFAFIAGAWTFNPSAQHGRLPNLASVIYDRSPLQERAPRIAATRLGLLAWIRYGRTLFDVARTPYPPLARSNVRVGVMVETVPTAFIRRYSDAARDAGPLTFDCARLGQQHDDCMYLPLNHDDLYERFADVWPEVIAFIRNGRFSDAADRQPPDGDPLARRRSR